MGETITVKEAAKLWRITERRVAVLCKEGQIEGAYKKDRGWVIPMDAENPSAPFLARP
jgi:hypothetical protein